MGWRAVVVGKWAVTRVTATARVPFDSTLGTMVSGVLGAPGSRVPRSGIEETKHFLEGNNSMTEAIFIVMTAEAFNAGREDYLLCSPLSTLFCIIIQ